MPEKIATLGAKFYRTSISLANEVKGLAIVGDIHANKAVIEATSHDDTFRGKLPGIPDVEPIRCLLNFDPQDTNHAQLRTDALAAATASEQTYIITTVSKKDGTKKAAHTITGFIRNWVQKEATVDGVLQAEFEIEVNAAMSYDADESTTPA